MRKVILSVMVTLDGFTAGPNGELDWIDVGDDALDSHLADLLRGIDGMFFGRVAYEMLAQHWPGAEVSSRSIEAEQARLMNTIPKIVLSRSQPDLNWGPAWRIGDDLAEAVSRLKEEPGKDLALFAGATAISAFLERDLIDEYRLIVFPVVLGDGQPLFKAPQPRRSLRLVETTRFDESGVVILRYQPIS
ncbi:MAG: dihydrofolate reductase family protein [Streptomyces sp.]|uniref:dihydrofolate reductase family protein n=1 Tax=Streptomyces sp. TaxID=1931 RepID=UPI003D6A651E